MVACRDIHFQPSWDLQSCLLLFAHPGRLYIAHTQWQQHRARVRSREEAQEAQAAVSLAAPPAPAPPGRSWSSEDWPAGGDGGSWRWSDERGEWLESV